MTKCIIPLQKAEDTDEGSGRQRGPIARDCSRHLKQIREVWGAGQRVCRVPVVVSVHAEAVRGSGGCTLEVYFDICCCILNERAQNPSSSTKQQENVLDLHHSVIFVPPAVRSSLSSAHDPSLCSFSGISCSTPDPSVHSAGTLNSSAFCQQHGRCSRFRRSSFCYCCSIPNHPPTQQEAAGSITPSQTARMRCGSRAGPHQGLSR